MLKNVNAYLVFSSTQKATKSECCSIVSEKTIEEHPNGLATPNCIFSPLKDFASHNVSSAKTCFLTLGCITEKECLCCVDVDYKHDIDPTHLKEQKKNLLNALRDNPLYVETTKNGLHIFFLMPVECHFGDNEHPLKINDNYIKDIEFMGFNEVKKDGTQKIHGRKILVWPTTTQDGSRYFPLTHKGLTEGLGFLTSTAKTFTPAQMIDLISKCCKKAGIEVDAVAKKEYVEKCSDESALRKHNKKPSFKTTTFKDCLEAVENSVVGSRDNTLYIVLQKMLDGEVDDVPSTWRDDLEKSCAKINFLAGGRAKISEPRFAEIDGKLGLKNHVIMDIFGHELRPEYEEMVLKSHDPSKEEKLNVLKLRMLSALQNATINDITEGVIELYGKRYTFNDFEDELELKTSARINLKEIQSHLSKIQNAADEKADQKLRDVVDVFLAEGQSRLEQCKKNDEDYISRLREFCSLANFPAVYMEMLILWLSQLFDRCLYPDHKTKWCLVQLSSRQSIAKSSLVEALSKAFGFKALPASDTWVGSSNENFARTLAKNRAYRPFLFFDEFFTNSKTQGDIYKQLAEAGTVCYRNLYCSHTIEKQALALLVFNTNNLNPIPASDNMATRYLILDYDRTQTNFKEVFQALQRRRGLKTVQDNNDKIAHEIIVDIAAYYIKNLKGSNFSPENFKYIIDYQRKSNNSYRYHTEEEELLCSQVTRLVKALGENEFIDQKLNKKVLIAIIKGDFETYWDKTADVVSVLREKFKDTYFGVPQKYNIAKLSKKIRDIAQTITECQRPDCLGKSVWTKTGTDRNPVSLRELYDYFEAFDSMQDLEPLETSEQKENAVYDETTKKTPDVNPDNVIAFPVQAEPVQVNTDVENLEECDDHYSQYPEHSQQESEEDGVMVAEYKTEIYRREAEEEYRRTHHVLTDEEIRKELDAKEDEVFKCSLSPEDAEFLWSHMDAEDAPF